MSRTLDYPATVAPHPGLTHALRRALATDAPLTLVGLGALALLVVALVGLVADPTVITGAPAWLKPLKFALSIAVYSGTLLWLLGQVQGHPRLVRLVSLGTATGFVAEMVVIVTQVVRGTTSHFNVATLLDAFLFDRMRDFIVLVFLMALLAAALLLRQRLPEPVMAVALRFGLGIALLGMLVAVLMTVPLLVTRAAFTAGRFGAHTVGAVDGGPSLPIVGWSTVGGDLRVAHFVGLHALQLLPLLGWALTRERCAWLGRGGRLALLRTAGLAYLSLVIALTWQALRGQSIVAPDGLTLAVGGAIGAVVATVTLAVVMRARRVAALPRPELA